MGSPSRLRDLLSGCRACSVSSRSVLLRGPRSVVTGGFGASANRVPLHPIASSWRRLASCRSTFGCHSGPRSSVTRQWRPTSLPIGGRSGGSRGAPAPAFRRRTASPSRSPRRRSWRGWFCCLLVVMVSPSTRRPAFAGWRGFGGWCGCRCRARGRSPRWRLLPAATGESPSACPLRTPPERGRLLIGSRCTRSAGACPLEVGARRRGSRGIGPLRSPIGGGGNVSVTVRSSARAGRTSLVGSSGLAPVPGGVRWVSSTRAAAIAQALRRADIDATPHGFRSSFKDWARNHDIEHEIPSSVSRVSRLQDRAGVRARRPAGEAPAGHAAVGGLPGRGRLNAPLRSRPRLPRSSTCPSGNATP